MPTSYTIRSALLAFVLVPFLVIIIFAGGYSLHTLEAKAAANMEEEIGLIARALRVPLSYALEQGDVDMIKQTLSSTQDFNRVYGVYIYDQNGRRLASSGSSKASLQNDKAQYLASQGDELSEFGEAGDEPMFSYFIPLTNSGERITGLLQVTRRGKDFSREVAKFRRQSLAVMTMSSLLLLLAVYFGYRQAIGRHMQAMRYSMQRIADGDRQQRLAVQGPLEFRVLSQGVNTMLDSIVASEKEIAQRREKEFDLKSQLYQAEKLAAIGRLAAGVAHELGTPLSVADGQAQRALRRATGKDAETLEKIRQQLARMTHIIRQLMNFARPNLPDKRLCSLNELVHSALAQLQPQETRTEVIVDSFQPDPQLFVDRLRIEQALTNLLRNAMQATPGGLVKVHWSADSQWVTLQLEDNGPGVPEDAMQHLFEPFFTTKAAGEGTGLGLAVVEAIVREHQGHIECDPSPLGGARFTLRLPLSTQASGSRAASQEPDDR